MPPDADKLRRRLNTPSVVGREGNFEDDDGALIATKTTKELKGTEVAIDGFVYDLTSFNHPGGGSINLFGGNDVTVTYNMIHPYHTSKHLEKMKKVGVLSDYKPE